jgi:hypothetical protein
MRMDWTDTMKAATHHQIHLAIKLPGQFTAQPPASL